MNKGAIRTFIIPGDIKSMTEDEQVQYNTVYAEVRRRYPGLDERVREAVDEGIAMGIWTIHDYPKSARVAAAKQVALVHYVIAKLDIYMNEHVTMATLLCANYVADIVVTEHRRQQKGVN